MGKIEKKDGVLTIEEQLRERFTHGHPDFIEKCLAEIDLHNDKNFDYTAGGDPLGNFKRVANILSMYPNLDASDAAIVAMIYALKQVDAYLWSKSNGHISRCESPAARLRDISVYAKIIDIIDSEPQG
jgi:hypothetical protein